MAIERLPAMVVRKYQERKVRMEAMDENLQRAWHEYRTEIANSDWYRNGIAAEGPVRESPC